LLAKATVESLDDWAISLVVFSAFQLVLEVHFGLFVAYLFFFFVFCFVFIFYAAHGGILYYRHSLPPEYKKSNQRQCTSTYISRRSGVTKAGELH